MSAPTLIERLKPVVRKPAATLFIESGVDRRFIAELTFGAVVLYLAGKYLDGFVDGLGIKALAKRHGRKIAKAISRSLSIIRESIDEQERNEELLLLEGALRDVAQELAEHASNAVAQQRAAQAVKRELEERGVPIAEATRIAEGIDTELMRSADG